MIPYIIVALITIFILYIMTSRDNFTAIQEGQATSTGSVYYNHMPVYSCVNGTATITSYVNVTCPIGTTLQSIPIGCPKGPVRPYPKGYQCEQNPNVNL